MEIHLQPDQRKRLYLYEVGKLHKELGNYQNAIEYFEHALTIDLKMHGENHEGVAAIRSELGLVWKDLGEYHKAIEYYELAFDSEIKNFGENILLCGRNPKQSGLGMATIRRIPQSN